MGKRAPQRGGLHEHGLPGASSATGSKRIGESAASWSGRGNAPGRVAETLLEQLSPAQKGLLRESEPPREPRPMLASLFGEAFSDPAWMFERKLDGERALALCGPSRVKLLSRNGRDLSSSYPEVVEALRRTPQAGPGTILDGEVVAFSGPVSSFARLQERIDSGDRDAAGKSSAEVYYYVFDFLHCGSHDLSRLPLVTRKRLLENLVDFEDPIRLLPHRPEEGEAFLREACHLGWEGIVAKRKDSRYRPGRSRSWLKLKCVNRQELVIGGFTEPDGTRKGFGALMVGYYEDEGGELRYAGKVGTGFDSATLERMTRLLLSRERSTPPFSARDSRALPEKGAHWVAPELVGQFGFSEWTASGRIRHARFLGLRRDKDPLEVMRERPVPLHDPGGYGS